MCRALLPGLMLLASGPSAAPAEAGAASRPWTLELSGSHRVRFSALDNQFRPVLGENDQALGLRTLLAARASAGAWEAVVELQDSRAYLAPEDGALSTSLVNAAEVLQAHVRRRIEGAFSPDATLDLRLGRWTQDLGSRRLLGRNRYRNTLQAYSGLAGDWHGGGGERLFAFAALPLRIRPFTAERARLLDNEIQWDEEDGDLRFWGVHYSRPLESSGTQLELYLFGLHEDDDPDGVPTRNRRLLTPGLRVHRPPESGAFDFDLETVLQFGRRRATALPTDERDLDVRAWFQHLRLGYGFERPWRPRLSVELDYASGDAREGDGEAGRFDSLFGPRRSELGPTGLYGPLGRENLLSAGLRLSLRPGPRSSGFLSLRGNWLPERADFFARTGVVDPRGASGRFAGSQLEFRYRYQLVPGRVRWETGGALFFRGRFLQEAPLAPGAGDPRFFYTQLDFRF